MKKYFFLIVLALLSGHASVEALVAPFNTGAAEELSAEEFDRLNLAPDITSLKFLPDERLAGLVESLKSPDDKDKLAALEEAKSLLELIDSKIASDEANVKTGKMICKKMKRPDGGVTATYSEIDINPYSRTKKRVFKALREPLSGFFSSGDKEVRLRAVRFIVGTGDYDLLTSVIEYVSRHPEAEEFCDVLFTASQERVWWSVLRGRLKLAQRCLESDKYSNADKEKLAEFLEKAAQEEKKGAVRTREWQVLDQRRRVARNKPVLFAVWGAALSMAFLTAVRFKNYGLAGRLGVVSFAAPLGGYLLLLAFVLASSPNIGDILAAVVMGPLFALPYFIAIILSAWQAMIVIVHLKEGQNVARGWWVFFWCVCLLNILWSYSCVTRSGFELTM